MKNEKINTNDDLEKWLAGNKIDEKTLNLKLFRYLEIERFKRDKIRARRKYLFIEQRRSR